MINIPSDPAPKQRRRRGGLFLGYWFDSDGHRICKVKRADLAEAYRLMSKHRDIVRGTPRASAGTGFHLGERMPLG